MHTCRFVSLAAAIVVGGGTLLAAWAANADAVGSHVTFGDDPQTLQTGGRTIATYTVVLPPYLQTLTNSVELAYLPGSLMTLKIEVENPNNLSWNMTVNGTTVMSFTHSRDRFGAIQELIPLGLLRAGNNTVIVRVVSGQGRLIVSDFALFFPVDVALRRHQH